LLAKDECHCTAAALPKLGRAVSDSAVSRVSVRVSDVEFQPPRTAVAL